MPAKTGNASYTGAFNATDLAKQFTVFSILMLQEDGKLSINDDIKKHLPQLNQWPFKITLKHLMEQTSGLLAQPNPKVKYIELQRDEQQNIIGIYLSNEQIKNLYYRMINK